MQVRTLGAVDGVRRTQIFQEVVQILAHHAVVTVSSIDEETRLEQDLRLDPTERGAFQIDLEKRYGFQHVPFIGNNNTVREIVDCIAKNKKE